MTTHEIVELGKELAPYLIPLVFGWLMKSPLKRWFPKLETDILARLDPSTVQNLIAMLADPKASQDWIASQLVYAAGKQGVKIDQKTAIKVLKAMKIIYDKAIKAMRKTP
jgi:hypothetical protein